MTSFRSGFVAVVGPANAGKSTLVNRIVGEKISIVSPKAQTTRNRILGIKSTEESQLILVDTPGYLAPLNNGKPRGALELALRTVSSESVSGVDQVLLVIDGERAVLQQSYLDSIIAGSGGVAPHVIAINKIDLVEKLKLLPLFERLSLLFPERSVELVPISARSGDGIEVLEQLLISRLPEAPAAYPEDQVTDATERFLAGELVREKLFGLLEQELPYSIAVSIDEWKREGGLLKITATIAVERESQKGIVIGKGGHVLKTAGERARIELEQMLETKVFLKLFVRVEPDWTESEAGLRKAGVVNF